MAAVAFENAKRASASVGYGFSVCTLEMALPAKPAAVCLSLLRVPASRLPLDVHAAASPGSGHRPPAAADHGEQLRAGRLRFESVHPGRDLAACELLSKVVVLVGFRGHSQVLGLELLGEDRPNRQKSSDATPVRPLDILIW
jgi:hypothetical protein